MWIGGKTREEKSREVTDRSLGSHHSRCRRGKEPTAVKESGRLARGKPIHQCEVVKDP